MWCMQCLEAVSICRAFHKGPALTKIASLLHSDSIYAGDDEEAAEAPQAVAHLPQQLTLPEGVAENLRQQWDALQSTVEDLRPIERFRVVGIAFRRQGLLLM